MPQHAPSCSCSRAVPVRPREVHDSAGVAARKNTRHLPTPQSWWHQAKHRASGISSTRRNNGEHKYTLVQGNGKLVSDAGAPAPPTKSPHSPEKHPLLRRYDMAAPGVDRNLVTVASGDNTSNPYIACTPSRHAERRLATLGGAGPPSRCLHTTKAASGIPHPISQRPQHRAGMFSPHLRRRRH